MPDVWRVSIPRRDLRGGVVKLTELWVVTVAGPRSTIHDVLFCTDPAGLLRQALGGLRPQDVVGIWTTREEAEPWARAELAAVVRDLLTGART